jgi:selenocysteine lyase/cysteine desulfurase
MTQNVLRYLEKAVGIELVPVDMVPTGFRSADAVMAAVEAVVAAHGGPGAFAIGVVSHLSSVPAVVLPVARFCALMGDTPVLVDGAHAPGNLLPLDVPGLGCAFYAANLHKWMYTPKVMPLSVSIPLSLSFSLSEVGDCAPRRAPPSSGRLRRSAAAWSRRS